MWLKCCQKNILPSFDDVRQVCNYCLQEVEEPALLSQFGPHETLSYENEDVTFVLASI